MHNDEYLHPMFLAAYCGEPRNQFHYLWGSCLQPALRRCGGAGCGNSGEDGRPAGCIPARVFWRSGLDQQPLQNINEASIVGRGCRDRWFPLGSPGDHPCGPDGWRAGRRRFQGPERRQSRFFGACRRPHAKIAAQRNGGRLAVGCRRSGRLAACGSGYGFGTRDRAARQSDAGLQQCECRKQDENGAYVSCADCHTKIVQRRRGLRGVNPVTPGRPASSECAGLYSKPISRSSRLRCAWTMGQVHFGPFLIVEG